MSGIKAVTDGINGAGVWRDDSQIDEINAVRHSGCDAGDVHVTIEVLE